MKCQLDKKIDHREVKKEFKDSLFFCPLLAKQYVGMNTMGIICGHCCLKCQQVGDILKDLLIKQVIDKNDFKRNPERFYDQLNPTLRKHAEVMAQVYGKTWIDIIKVCQRCNPTPVVPVVQTKVEPTEATMVGKRDLY
jgi:hypothetical protein